MTLITALTFIAYCAVAFSFAGAVRSAIDGGARFAMLKGALFGLAVSMFLGSGFFAAKPFLTAGIGAMAAYPGGGFGVFSPPDRKPIRFRYDLLPEAVNGALSGGIFCGMFSFYISSAAGRFNVLQVVMLLILAPVFALAAYAAGRLSGRRLSFILDEKLTFPLSGVLAAIIIFGCFSGDSLIISSTLAGAVLSALAYLASAVFNCFDITSRIGSLFGDGVLTSAVHGLLHGTAVSLTFLICYAPMSTRFDEIDPEGFSQIGLHPVAGIIATATIVLLAIDQTQYFIIDKWSENQILAKILDTLKKFEFVLYCILPFVISCMGNGLLPEVMASGILTVFVWQLLCRRVFLQETELYIYVVILLIPIIGLMFVRFTTDWQLTTRYFIFIYTLLYEGSALYLDYTDLGKRFLKNGALPRHILLIAHCALLIAGTYI